MHRDRSSDVGKDTQVGVGVVEDRRAGVDGSDDVVNHVEVGADNGTSLPHQPYRTRLIVEVETYQDVLEVGDDANNIDRVALHGTDTVRDARNGRDDTSDGREDVVEDRSRGRECTAEEGEGDEEVGEEHCW